MGSFLKSELLVMRCFVKAMKERLPEGTVQFGNVWTNHERIVCRRQGWKFSYTNLPLRGCIQVLSFLAWIKPEQCILTNTSTLSI